MIKKELIAVIKKDILFEKTQYREGIFNYDFKIIHNITQYQEEMARYLAEEDYNYKQIISYIVFTHENSIFLMERSPKASEQKLKNKLSLGIGGHLNKTDLAKEINSWGTRELYEEINYHDDFYIQPIAMINDESNDIGKLHFGIVYLMHAQSNTISIKSELKSGKIITQKKCLIDYYDRLEPWSKLVIDFISLAKNSLYP